MPQGKSDQARLDAMARKQGFPNYAAWKAWNEKYRKPVTGTQAPKKKNFIQSLFEKIPGHPAQTIGYANKKIEESRKKRPK